MAREWCPGSGALIETWFPGDPPVDCRSCGRKIGVTWHRHVRKHKLPVFRDGTALYWRKTQYGTPRQEEWAKGFECSKHGLCVYEMVSTKKTCMVPMERGGVCDQGLIRLAR